MPERIDEFTKWGDFVRHCTESHSDMDESERTSRNNDDRRDPWSGCTDYAEATQLALAGWPKGVERAHKLAEAIEHRLYNLIERETIRYDVAGDLLDIGRYCAGEPEHWGVWESTLVEGPGTRHVYIVVNVVASGGIDARVLMARGSAIAALIHLLELAGQRVKLDMVCADSVGGYRYEMRAAVKEYTEPLDLDRVTYAVAHPSVLRRHFFSSMECLPADFRQNMGVGGTYGRCVETNGAKGDIYMPMQEYGDRRWDSEATAEAWVKSELVRLGVIKSEA